MTPPAWTRVTFAAATGATFGAATGLGEVMVLGVRRLGLHQILWFDRNVVWMAPSADVLLFAAVGLVLGLIAWRWPRVGSERVLSTVLAFLACWSVVLVLPWVDERAGAVLAAGLAFQIGRSAARRPEGFRRIVRRALPGLLATTAALGFGVPASGAWLEHQAGRALPDAPSGAPNVLLLILDTVRAFSLSTYGYARPTSPHLTEVARAGVQFDRAVVSSSWTLPSHESIFTGRDAREVGLDWLRPLQRRFATLAEVLAAHGYRTGGFVGNQFYGAPAFGLDRGFQHYRVFPVTWVELALSSALGRRVVNSGRFRRSFGWWDIANRNRAWRVNAAFLDWLSGTGHRPFFAFLNYFDAHEPYLPPEPDARRFGPLPAPQPNTVFALRNADLLREVRRRMTAEELTAQQNAYDASIASADRELGQLLEDLRRRGVLDNTIVVVAADHGEALGEGGRFLHGFDLSAATTIVPLIIRFPMRVPAGLHVTTPVALRDLAATVLDLAGLDSEHTLPGSSLSRFWSAPAAADAARPIFSSVKPPPPGGSRTVYGIVLGNLHYIRDSKGVEELYDLGADPLETHDLMTTAEGPRIARPLRAALDSVLAGR